MDGKTFYCIHPIYFKHQQFQLNICKSVNLPDFTPGHEMQECVGIPDGMEEASEKVFEEVKFIFVRLNVLREYLERELAMPNLPFEYNFDRAIDDWVFMCFFVGKCVCVFLMPQSRFLEYGE